MKTGRRSFLKNSILGALGSLALIGTAKAEPVKSIPRNDGLGTQLKTDGKITFILDIPNNEVRCKGFVVNNDNTISLNPQSPFTGKPRIFMGKL